MFGYFLTGKLNTFAQQYRIIALFHRSDTFMNHRLSQNRRGCCTVTGRIIGIVGDFNYQLGSHIFKRIIQFNLFGDCDTVINDQRRTIFLIQNNIAPLRTHCSLYGISQIVNTLDHRITGFFSI
ncbi:hypothetical protein SDC9_132246 [bioreactor metagenome]|uniref:Uncharacterized protein n=1 Tax=bioreactor metagenome TaxID=1076179 RepID=A0A645D7Y0_9ZZZZ